MPNSSSSRFRNPDELLAALRWVLILGWGLPAVFAYVTANYAGGTDWRLPAIMFCYSLANVWRRWSWFATGTLAGVWLGGFWGFLSGPVITSRIGEREERWAGSIGLGLLFGLILGLILDLTNARDSEKESQLSTEEFDGPHAPNKKIDPESLG